MKILRPVKSNTLYQAFGDNQACALTGVDGKIVRPFVIVGKAVGGTCPVGFGDFYKLINMKGHNGEDWAAYSGEDGYFNVEEVGMKWWGRVEIDEARGQNLYVFSLEPIAFTDEEFPVEASQHARELWLAQGKKIHVCFVYSHIKQYFLDDKPKIQIGWLGDGSPQMAPEIKLGDHIFKADNTGASAGDHLHRSMKFRFKNSMIAGSDNGYQGAVSDKRWYVNEFVLDYLGVTPTKPKYYFANNLEYGQETIEAIKLQEILKYEGCMPPEVQTANFYGKQTRLAVAKFQKKYGIFSISPGTYCYEKTRAKLNQLYG